MADADDTLNGAAASIVNAKAKKPPRWTTTINCLSCQQAGAAYVPANVPKICAWCGAAFLRNSGPQKYCLGCRTEARKKASEETRRKWHEARREEAAARSRARYRENREAILAYQRSEEYRAPRRALAAKRYASDPHFRLNRTMSRSIWTSLVKGKGGRSWQALVGYSADDLRRHLERQFSRGMTWQNYGNWEVDHIRPLSSFSYTSPHDEAFQQAWALTNLRPLWRRENRSKHARRIYLL